MNFNTITAEQEKAAKAKFNEHNVGIIINRYAGSANLRSADAAKFQDLMDAKLYSLDVLVNKLKEIGRSINNQVEDDIIGDTSVMFISHNAKDEKVEFSYLEAYAFLRGIIRERKEAAEYKAKKARLQALELQVEGSKSIKERRKDAQSELEKLRAEMGIEAVPTQD